MTLQNLEKKIFLRSENGKNIISFLENGVWYSMQLKKEIISLKQIENVIQGERKIVVIEDSPPTFIKTKSNIPA